MVWEFGPVLHLWFWSVFAFEATDMALEDTAG
jgi:hypothetical protein